MLAVEPSIEMNPQGAIQEYNLGDAAFITCVAEGKPVPVVTWGRVVS